jgi:starch synthase
MKILFLAAEAEPFIKIGGLADVAGSLPLALRHLSNLNASDVPLDVRLVLPLHQAVRLDATELPTVAKFSVYRGGVSIPVIVLETSLDGMPVYFISGTPISNTPTVYSPDPAHDREKYAFFSLAALELIQHLDWQPDIIHANDWHTSLALYALHSRENGSVQDRPRTVLTVHNLAYLGGDGSEVLSAYDFRPLTDHSLPVWAQSQPLPLGLWSANAIVPVSPTYAREIHTPDFGCGLDTYLATRIDSLTGILNGLDINFWDPHKDKFLPACFDAEQLPARALNKTALQKTLVLKHDESIPLLAMVGRVDYQKGLDIAFRALRDLVGCKWQFVILGSGDPVLEDTARQLQSDYPDRIRAVIRYDAELSHMLYGGADMFLMPSRYEPCGLAQMIAMRYGCVPVVHATGGLIDTVHEGTTGFLFENSEPISMEAALVRALDAYADKVKWQQFQRNSMKEDFSWTRSAGQYALIYKSLLPNS